MGLDLDVVEFSMNLHNFFFIYENCSKMEMIGEMTEMCFC